MSDTESFFVEDEVNIDQELEVSIDRELIAVVRVNRFLYKSKKLYANANVKSEAWTQIGESLTHPLEGPAAEKRFYALRQRFGKEWRKVMQSVPRSGAGADQPTYTPTWVLYKDLKFLKDIIKPRKTVSNYKSKASHLSVLGVSSPFSSTSAPGDQVTVLRTMSPMSSMPKASPGTSNCLNSHLLTSFAHTDESSIDISEGLFSPLPATPPPTTSPLAITSGSGSNTAVAQMQEAASNISIKRKVPPLDSFATKKRQEADAVNKSLIEQSKGLTDLAAKIGQAIMAPPVSRASSISKASPGIQPMLSAIEFALGAVPEHAQLQCLIGVLQHINDFSQT